MQRLKPLPAELQHQRAQKPLESVVKKVKEKRKQHLEESVEDMPAAHRMRILDLVNRGELLPDEAAKILRK